MAIAGLTMTSLFDWAVGTFRGKSAIEFGDEVWTYSYLGEQARRIANALVGWGIQKGDRVSIFSTNTPEYLAAYYGIQLAGAVVSPVGIRLPSGDPAYLINDSGARVLFFHADAFPSVESIRDQTPSVERYVCWRAREIALPDWVARYEDVIATTSASEPEQFVTPGDVTAIMYTGGTTGRPRGVVHNHASMSFVNFLLHSLDFASNKGECTAALGPLSHGTILVVLPTLLGGGKLVILKEFDPGLFLRTIEQKAITAMFAVPTMIYLLLDLPQTYKTDLSSLRRILYGASPMSPDRMEDALKIFGDVFVQSYGQTEGGGTRLSPEDHRVDTPQARRRLESCGRPVIGSKIRLVDEDDNEVALGEVGEIAIRGPYMMSGYWNRAEETRNALRGGWLHTGDMARVDDDGYFYIVDRKKDMIITGAFNVYSKEVEDVLTEHPSVSQAAVIGVPDPKWGEAVKACVVLKPGVTVSADELIAFVRERKGPVQAPKSVDFLEAMPLTQAFKPDKRAMRSSYWGREERQVH